MKVLREVLLPKIVKADLPIINNILETLFPGIEAPKRSNKKLVNAITDVAKGDNLQVSDELI